MPSINPYQPSPSPSSETALVSFRFCGVIEQADYQQLLPKWETEWWLCSVLAVLLGLCVVIFGPFSILIVIVKKKLVEMVILVAFWTLMLSGLWFLIHMTNARHRAARYLKRCPGMLGTVQGEFTNQGLTLFDGESHHWYGPIRLLQTAVEANGIRVHLDRNIYQYLAITERLFEGYDVESARRLQSEWSRLAKLSTANEISSDLELSKRLGPPPSDAIPFHGAGSISFPWRTPEIRRRLQLDLGVWLLVGPFFLFNLHHVAVWIRWCGVLALGSGLIANFIQWKRYFGHSQMISWYQSGWINAQELAIYSDHFGIRLPFATIVQKVDSPDEVLLTTLNGQSYRILRTMVANDEQWQKILAIPIDP